MPAEPDEVVRDEDEAEADQDEDRPDATVGRAEPCGPHEHGPHGSSGDDGGYLTIQNEYIQFILHCQ